MRLTTPVAILLGFALVAVAVYLALRSHDAPAARVDAVAASTSVASLPDPLPSPTPATPTAPTAPSGALADANRSLAAQHDALVRSCWTPTKRAGSVVYSLHAQFDGKGKLATKLTLDPRGPQHLDVSECLAQKLAPIEISPANAPAIIDVILTLP